MADVTDDDFGHHPQIVRIITGKKDSGHEGPASSALANFADILSGPCCRGEPIAAQRGLRCAEALIICFPNCKHPLSP